MNFTGFGGRLGLLQVRDCKRGYLYREDYGLKFCEGTYSEVWQRKPRLELASGQTNW